VCGEEISIAMDSVSTHCHPFLKTKGRTVGNEGGERGKDGKAENFYGGTPTETNVEGGYFSLFRVGIPEKGKNGFAKN